MLTLLKKLQSRENANPALVSFVYQESLKPTMVDPAFAEAYVYAALSSGVIGEVSAVALYGEVPYASKTPLSVSRRGSTAIMEVTGGIVTRHEDGLCGAQASYEGIMSTMDTLMADDTVDNIVARFQSGGGLVAGMVNASRHIASMRGKGKGLYGIADTNALSAAYGLISAFDEVWVNHGCAVGSIGVFLKHVSREEMNANMGVEVTYIYAGDFKIMGHPDGKLSEADISHFQESVSKNYEELTQLVAENRSMTVEAVVNTQAQCYTSENSNEVGLSDRVGSFADLLTHIENKPMTPEELAKIKSDAMAEGRAQLEQEQKAETDAETAAKVAADKLASAAQATATQVAADSRKATVEAMCGVAGLDATATATYVNGVQSVAEVQTSLRELADTTTPDINPTQPADPAPATAKASEVWGKVDWEAA